MNQEAIWKGDNQDYGKYNFRSNIITDIDDNLSISLDFGGRIEKRNNLIQNSYLMASWLQYSWPIFAPKTPDGKIASTNYGLTAYMDKDLTGYIQDQRNNLQSNLTIDYNIPFVDGLSAKVSASYDMFFRDEKQWLKKYTSYRWSEEMKESIPASTRGVDKIILSNWKSSESTLRASLNYNKDFSGNSINALVLYEESEYSATNFSADRVNYIIPIDQIFAGPQEGKSNSGGAADNGRQSLVGRLNYNYLGKYLLEYSFRYDGSAKFPVDKRWGYFSGASFGWRLSEEDFIKNNLGIVSNLKLRGSWGKLGNDATGKFQYLTGYRYPFGSYVYGNNVVSNGFVDTGIPNPDITWEESDIFNVGVDISIWQGKFEMETDVFYRNRTNLLAKRSLQLPSTFGATLPSENLNSDNTRGFEVALTHNNFIGDFSYRVRGNLNFAKSKYGHIEQREFYSQYDNWRNNLNDRWKNVYWGYRALGQFQSVEEIKTSPIQDNRQNSTLRPGDVKYQDLNSDGIIDENDIDVIGHQQEPEITYGLLMNFSWNRFELNMTWQGTIGADMQQQHFMIQPFSNGMNAYAYYMDRWHRADPFDPNSEWVPGKYPSTILDGSPNNRLNSSFWLLNTTYLRLKDLSIKYDFNFLEKYRIKGLAIFLSGQNLITVSKKNYIDPEAPTGRLSYYPQQALYNAGLSLTF